MDSFQWNSTHQNRPLRIGIPPPVEPFNFECSHSLLQLGISKKCTHPGFAIEAMQFLLGLLDVEYQLVQLNTATYGYRDNGMFLCYLPVAEAVDQAVFGRPYI